MELRKKRIRSLLANLPAELQGYKVVVAAPVDVTAEQLRRLGINVPLEVGTSILPAVVGPVTRFNAEGKNIVHRDRPKETRYRQVMWTWTELHGLDEVEQEGICDVPYKRYPRTFVPPPSVELLVAIHEGNPLVVAPEVSVDFENEAPLLHVVNVFLEAFGSCRILQQTLEPVAVTVTRRLNWSLLPPGVTPWKTLEPELRKVIESQSKGKKPVAAFRLEYINRYRPEFVAVGNGGFSGYVVFGFPRLGFYILECAKYANATYVFEKDWEQLAQLTKAEILDNNLQAARFIHVEGWKDHVARLFNSK
jgi:hypothetical protein